MFQIVGVGDNGPPCAHQQQKPVKIQSKIPLVPPRPPTIIGGPLPCLGDQRGPSANSGSLRFLDLGDAGGPCREPYGPLGAPMATQLVRYLQFFPARPFWDHRWNWTSMTMRELMMLIHKMRHVYHVWRKKLFFFQSFSRQCGQSSFRLLWTFIEVIKIEKSQLSQEVHISYFQTLLLWSSLPE